MTLAKKNCRVCGNSYEACRSAKKDTGAFKWQEVACSPECGAVYLQKITESRNPAPVTAKEPRKGARPAVISVDESTENTASTADEPADTIVE